MKAAVTIARFMVGTLFILSGLVKANDPLGLSYKMQEFFEVWRASISNTSFLADVFSYLHVHSLALSIVMITLEIITGVALLIGWRKKLILNTLLILIVFFTFLTAYAYGSGKFKNCGCFGDCLPITPLTSFIKDLILLGLILFLLVKQRYITPLAHSKSSITILIGSLLATILFQWYTLNYLPIADCLPFKKGNNIVEQMRIPANAIQDSFAMKFIYERGGKRFEFAPEELPADLATYKFIDRTQKLIRKGNAEPLIKGFTLIGSSGADSTTAILNTPTCLLLFAESFSSSHWITQFKQLATEAQKKSIPLYVVTSELEAGHILLQENGLTNIPVFSCDNTAVRTAARTNPTIFLIKKGTIIAKKSFRQMDKIIPSL